MAFFPAEGIGVLFLNKLRHDHISVPQLLTLKNMTALLSPDSVGTVIGARVHSLAMVISYVLTIPHVHGDLVATESPLRNCPLNYDSFNFWILDGSIWACGPSVLNRCKY